eukprot:TRINITY_DN15664_c0_g1_i1.p1 TRINITY_DN15664_c0_g1~~TRINITY_DN15664_c0_g1_i1.p1  ORF type:complete len:733 (+),score=170.30 TRINITY_DN15664_c0_g1_i1:138-2201(+)
MPPVPQAGAPPRPEMTAPPPQPHRQQQLQQQSHEEMHIFVSDPATKQKIALPFALTEHTNGRALYFENLREPGRRESHLCMLYQKSRCKSSARCNQIHADRSHIARLRAEFWEANGVAEASDEPLAHQRRCEVVVVDPSHAASKIVVPFSKTQDTEGRRRFLEQVDRATPAAQQQDFHLCSTFMYTAKCTQGSACPNIHGSREFLRYLQEGNKPCCPYHGHTVSLIADYRNKLFMINKLGLRCPLPVNRIAATRGLSELLQPSNPLVFSCNRVCRLHQEKRCHFGDDCANLHVCREFYALYCNVTNPAEVALPPPPQQLLGAPPAAAPPASATPPVATPLPGFVAGMGGIALQPAGGPFLSSSPPPGIPSQGRAPRPPRSLPTGVATPGPAAGIVVTGTPLSGPPVPQEGWGVPIATEEGSIPLQLLPPKAQAAAAQHAMGAANPQASQAPAPQPAQGVVLSPPPLLPMAMPAGAAPAAAAPVGVQPTTRSPQRTGGRRRGRRRGRGASPSRDAAAATLSPAPAPAPGPANIPYAESEPAETPPQSPAGPPAVTNPSAYHLNLPMAAASSMISAPSGFMQSDVMPALCSFASQGESFRAAMPSSYSARKSSLCAPLPPQHAAAPCPPAAGAPPPPQSGPCYPVHSGAPQYYPQHQMQQWGPQQPPCCQGPAPGVHQPPYGSQTPVAP